MTVSLRGLRFGLIASLALNAFLVALAATMWVQRDDGHHRYGGGGPGLMPSPRRLMAQLDPADRPKLEKLMAADRAEMRREIGEVMAARDAVSRALHATPYVRADADAAFTALRERGGALTKRAQDSMLDLADQLDDAGRARLAEAIAAEHREWRERSRERRAQRRAARDAQAREAARDTAPTAAPSRD